MKLLLLAFSWLMAGTGAHAAAFLFEDFNDLAASGWTIVNASAPPGSSSWFQGNPAIFTAFDGAADSYAAADAGSTTAGGTISTWLISPEVIFEPREILAFLARAADPGFDDALNVRISTAGPSLDLARFHLLLAINAGNATGGMPTDWTSFETLLGVPHATGRIAFEYTVGAGHSAGYIGVDSVRGIVPLCASSAGSGVPALSSSSDVGDFPPLACPEPGTLVLAASALLMAFRSSRPRILVGR